MNDTEWSRALFDRITLGGTWTVPRSGLIFNKTDDHTLTLALAMPWTDEIRQAAEQGSDVPKSKAELIAYQQADFDTIQAKFKLAGLNVVGREKIA